MVTKIIDSYFSGLAEDIAANSNNKKDDPAAIEMRTISIALRIVGGLLMATSFSLALHAVVILATNPLAGIMYLIFAAMLFVLSRDAVVMGMNSSRLAKNFSKVTGNQGILDRVSGFVSLGIAAGRELESKTPEQLRDTWVFQHIYKLAIQNQQR
jgi:hypothetical protein